METKSIVVRGAREHNLRNVNLELPRNKLICFTGVSGSGKSSLAFDTIYAEGQRRYVESLSSYARQFLGQLPKPDVDHIAGLSPSISIQQKSASRNPRSTVGTITEVADFLRVMYARLGQGHCPNCSRPITAQTREQIIARILALPEGTRFLILAPVVRGQKGEFKDFFAEMSKRGYVRARVDGQMVKLADDLKLDKKIKHNIEIVVDRLQCGMRNADFGIQDGVFRTRVAEAVEQALSLAEGNLIISIEPEKAAKTSKPDVPNSEFRIPQSELLLSAHYACTHCDISYEPPTPQLFSFNSPQGMCRECDGLGNKYSFDPDLLIPDPKLSMMEGAIPLVGPLKGMGRWRKHIFEGVAKHFGIDLAKPWKSLSKQHQDRMLLGGGDAHIVYEWKQRGGKVWKHGGKWEGIVPQLESQFKKTAAGPRRMQLEKYMRVLRCPACQGQRLNPQARAARVGGKTLIELGNMPIGELVPWFEKYEKDLGDSQRVIAGELLKEIRARIGFLLNVGLHYLSLDRSAPTLSGGETQRIRLAGQIGSGLVGVLYVLDEPSIGLHPRDNIRLLRSLERLRDMGNTVLVVEHDEDTMRASDVLVDFGPGPGTRGGHIVASGTPAEVFANKDSLTGQYLSGAKRIEIPPKRRPLTGKAIHVIGAKHNNLKNVSVDIPLGVFTVVTGVSGSGKSSLVNDVLKLGMRNAELGTEDQDEEDGDSEFRNPNSAIRISGEIQGAELIDKLIDIDQSPIGRTPRSNPATYIKLWDEIRSLYAQMSEAKIRGYQPGRFSFNKPGGRCEACEGNGSNRLEMDFLADVWVTCPVCEGHRFNRETLQVKYRGKSIQDVLEMEVAEALAHFEHVPKIHAMLKTLHDVGLDYIKLGQPSPTLSGGEAQRIKLAKELVRRSTGKTLYILDEPTTGLHFEDIRKLLEVLHGFVDAGNSVLVIEHNLDVIKTADWLIDLGPDGGSGGGEIVATGTPEQVAGIEASFTGVALKPMLDAKLIAESKPKKSKKGKGTASISSSEFRVPSSEFQPGYITHLEVQGASQHNLKNVNARLPREQMTVFCGPSGSGKSSLAIDTIYAEGQRRYVESLSSYARQFLGQVQKPKVEHITGLSPSISIEQKTTSKSPRSTVGTITEIYDYLRILYARLGQRHCPSCGQAVGTQSADEIVEKVLSLPEGTKLYLMAPLERKGQEKYETLWDEIRKAGYVRMRVDGKSFTVEEPPAIDHRRKHRIEVIVDRNVVRPGNRTRLAEAVEQALDLGRGVMHIAHVDPERDETRWKVDVYSQHLACEKCNLSFEPLNPHNYSFNSPLGWCPTCEGLGFQRGANVNLMLRDGSLTLRQGAIAGWPSLEEGSAFLPFAEGLAKHVGFDLDTPYDDLEPAHQRVILHGTGDAWIGRNSERGTRSAERKTKNSEVPSSEFRVPRFQYKGLFPAVDEASRVSFVYRQRLDHVVDEVPCSTCHGSRLRSDAAATRFAKLTLGEVCARPLGDTLRFFDTLPISKSDRQVAGELLREIGSRLKFLVDVGLDYLTLGRQGPTLSGGEAQRIRLASQIGSGLTGVLYVLDEPTIGLHPRDNERLLQALHNLRDLGNTLLLVEHDREVIAAADHLLDFGPGAGDQGGEITASGSPKQIMQSKTSLTGQYLSGKLAIPVPSNRRIFVGRVKEALRRDPTAKPSARDPKQESRSSSGLEDSTRPTDDAASIAALSPAGQCLSILGARQHNLRNIDVHIPLGVFVAVTGVSGSGKSSLVNEVLYNTLARKLHRARTAGAAHDDIRGLEHVDKIINVDQDPIGNSPSSNPATYTGLFDLVRELFTRLPESKIRGYQPRRFSFNQKGGRCEDCEGMGQKRIEMHFLPDVWVECDTCKGRRYNPETLAVQYHGKSIADVLDMRISEALELFGNIPKIRNVLKTLDDVGLGYMALGQPAPTMSGGEAQRVKLAAELARPSTGRTLYLLDEPTTGLHFDDIRKLLEVLQRLVDLGNTVIVVEHNLDVIKTADWIIDIGPEAGIGGGMVVAQGTPEEVVAQAADPLRIEQGLVSHTGRLLAKPLAEGPFVEREKFDPEAARRKQAGDLDIAEVGREAKLPWEVDGRKWHIQDRITTTGKAVRWDGAAVAFVIEQVEALGGFGETNWTHRSIIEVAGKNKSQGWFLHAMTGHEGYAKFVFRVARNTFKQADLTVSLGLKSLQDIPGLENFARDKRVEVSNLRGPWQEVVVTAHTLAEVDTPAFHAFLKQAVAAFDTNLVRLQTNVEDMMPWKQNGEKWHLSDKGFPIGKKPKWDLAILPRLLQAIREVEPKVEIKWDVKDAVTVRVPGVSRFWCRVKTKQPSDLEAWFVGKPGQFNLSRVEKFGRGANISQGREDGGDVVQLHFANAEHLHTAELKSLLKEHLAGFRELFMNGS